MMPSIEEMGKRAALLKRRLKVYACCLGKVIINMTSRSKSY